jgi:hypothetical protein
LADRAIKLGAALGGKHFPDIVFFGHRNLFSALQLPDVIGNQNYIIYDYTIIFHGLIQGGRAREAQAGRWREGPSPIGDVPVSYQKRVKNPCTECERMNGNALKTRRNFLAGLTSG